MDLGKFIVWLVVGAVAGTLAGRLVTFSRAGFGRWINLAVGMIGAMVGGFIFWVFNIDLGLGDFKVSLQDLIAAFAGSMLCICLWWVGRKLLGRKSSPPAAKP